MKIRVTLTTGTDYEVDLNDNSLESLKDLDDKLAMIGNGVTVLLKAVDGSRIFANNIVVYKEV